MSTFPWRLVTFDVDGTLTRGHGWRYFAERTGQLAAYEGSNVRFLRREIDEDEHLRDLLNLAAGRRLDEVEAILEATPKVAGIGETAAALRARGARVALLTHNPDYVCRWYQKRFGFDDGEGTVRTNFVDGRIAAYGPVRAAKAEGLSLLLRRANAAFSETVHSGDGWADAAIFPTVGGGIALNSRLPEVRAAADRAIDLDDLRGIVPVLEELRPRRR